MRYSWMDDYLLAKRGVTKDFQPVWNWIRYHIGGKMFAAICLDRDHEPLFITLKLDPVEGEFLRAQYADILPGYYTDKLHWNSVRANGAVPDALLRQMLDKSYRLVLAGFSKKRQREILGLTCCGMECAACGAYPAKCPGCEACAGKVFHAPPGKACPIYECAVRKRKLVHCANCEQIPCSLWRETRDPQLSPEEFAQSIRDRFRRLKEE